MVCERPNVNSGDEARRTGAHYGRSAGRHRSGKRVAAILLPSAPPDCAAGRAVYAQLQCCRSALTDHDPTANRTGDLTGLLRHQF